jgi:hypothetical protein
MRRKMIAGSFVALALTVGLWGSAVGAAASPTWYSCAKAVKVGKSFTGKYENSTCSKVSATGTGKYELTEGIGKGKPFKGKATEVALEMSEPGNSAWEWNCGGLREEGFPVLPDRVVHVKMTFVHCKFIHSEGQPAGTIVTPMLSGKLGYIDEAKGELGLDLANEAEPGAGLMLEFIRESGARVRMHGSLIAAVRGNVNVVNKRFHTDYTDEYETEVAPGDIALSNIPSFEGGPTDILEAEMESGSGWTPEGGRPGRLVADLLQKGEALEIKT